MDSGTHHLKSLLIFCLDSVWPFRQRTEVQQQGVNKWTLLCNFSPRNEPTQLYSNDWLCIEIIFKFLVMQTYICLLHMKSLIWSPLIPCVTKEDSHCMLILSYTVWERSHHISTSPLSIHRNTSECGTLLTHLKTQSSSSLLDILRQDFSIIHFIMIYLLRIWII